MKQSRPYEVTVTVYDGNSGGDSITVTINVTKANVGSTNNAPVVHRWHRYNTFYSREHDIRHKTSARAVAATDSDNDTLTYSLGGTDAASFSINTSTGQLQTKAALDYEDQELLFCYRFCFRWQTVGVIALPSLSMSLMKPKHLRLRTTIHLSFTDGSCYNTFYSREHGSP